MYLILCLFFMMIINHLNNNCHIFTDQYYLSEISDNFNIIHAYMFIMSALTLIHYTHYMSIKRNNIKLLSYYIEIPMIPCLFLLTFNIEVLARMCNGEVRFNNMSIAYLYYGYFMSYYLILIPIITFLAKLSTIHRGVMKIECF